MDDLSKGMIVFDVDGTLFDTKPGILDTFEDVFKHFDIGYFDRDEGIIKMLSKLLKAGYDIAIATNKTFPQVDRLLSITEVDKSWFRCIKTALETGGLDKRGMLEQIRDEYTVSTIIMVGDTNGDRLAAEESEVGFLGVTYGYGFNNESKYDFVTVDSPQKIFEAIEKLSGGIRQ